MRPSSWSCRLGRDHPQDPSGTVADYQAVITDTSTYDAEVAAIRGFGVPVEAVDTGEPPP